MLAICIVKVSTLSFIFMEGSDQGAQSLENVLTAHLTEIEDWVSAGGVLFLNAAPNVGDGMSFGFGVTLLYSDGTSAARAENGSGTGDGRFMASGLLAPAFSAGLSGT